MKGYKELVAVVAECQSRQTPEEIELWLATQDIEFNAIERIAYEGAVTCMKMVSEQVRETKDPQAAVDVVAALFMGAFELGIAANENKIVL